jgi:hypothetical protein
MRSTTLFHIIIPVLAVVFVTTVAEAEDKVLTAKNPGAKNRNGAVRVDDAVIVISDGKATLSFGVVAMSERCTPQGDDAPWLTIKLLRARLQTANSCYCEGLKAPKPSLSLANIALFRSQGWVLLSLQTRS